jgi:hypothetical protein
MSVWNTVKEKIFGFSFAKQLPDPVSPVPSLQNDGASIVDVGIAGGGYAAYNLDLDFGISTRTEIDLIRRYRDMSLHAEIEQALDDICNESITPDGKGEYVKLELNKVNVPPIIKEKLIEYFNKILHILNFNHNGHEIFRNWYRDGKIYYQIILNPDPTMGIYEIRYIDPLRVRKVKEIRRIKLKDGGFDIIETVRDYFVYSPVEQSSLPSFSLPNDKMNIKLAADSVVYVPSGLFDGSKVVSYLHKAIKPLNQLRMIEDAAVIYRLVRAPERRVFYIDTGSLPKTQAETYVLEQMNRYKNKISYDPSTGELKDSKRFMHMLEDFWLPRREGGKGTEVSTLQGGATLGRMEDVEYFMEKLQRSLNIPMSRLQTDTGFNMGRASEISRDELKFTKFIEKLRMKFSNLFLDMLRVECIATGLMSDEDWKNIKQDIRFIWSTDSYFTESKETEMTIQRMQALASVAPYKGTYFSTYWIQKNILRMTDEDIEVEAQRMQMEMEQELAVQQQAALDAMAMQNAMSPVVDPNVPPGQQPKQLEPQLDLNVAGQNLNTTQMPDSMAALGSSPQYAPQIRNFNASSLL